MSYQALYRKFRPKEFSEVRGQDHIVTTLKNQIKTGRIGHAYLFTGTRGTGKTSMAKLFAKAVNCKNPKEDGSPCGECTSCKAADSGNSFNIIEMDAAANSGVDDIRQIIEEVGIPPMEDRYKVYIIDEVHEISGKAFNALLKTLEEPPEYAIFILATTEVQALPITILSRCQRYDFHRISIDTITGRLQEILANEGVKAEEKAVRYVAKAGDGSMRDSVSLLDQCIAFYIGEELTYDKVLNVLGAVDTAVFSKLLRCVIGHDVRGAIEVVEDVIVRGREPEQFVTDFTWYLRNLMLLSSGEDMEDALEMSSDNLALLKEEVSMVDTEEIIRYIQILSELSARMKYAAQKRVQLEIGMIRLCTPQMDKDEGAVLKRVEILEQRMEEGIPMAATGYTMEGQSSQPMANVPKKTMPDAVEEDVKRTVREWRNIVAELDGPLAVYLKSAKPTVDESGKFILVFDAHEPVQQMNYQNCLREENKELIRQAISDHMEVNIEPGYVLNESGVNKDRVYPDALKKFEEELGMPIETEDF
ncbi:MAG: DNA polymerase III subunit gamma/tau [Lachnospiraceae bacterium]|nr:DNA polymerase III subunit gamma/tau [Lachnospiraceae bacterium]